MFKSYFEGAATPRDTVGIETQLPRTPNGLTREFDPMFAKHAGQLPVPFLRALAKRESNFNTQDRGGSFWGILQVGWRGRNSVLRGFNLRENTDFTREDLLDPDVNVRIAADLINRIANAYRDLAKESPLLMGNMVPNFGNKEFVKLLLAGWNSGYSRAGGVQRVARFLAKRGIPVTHEAVFANAANAGATKFLRATENEHARRKKRWQAGTADLFFRQTDFTPNPPDNRFATTTPPETPSGKGLAFLAIPGALFTMLALGRR